MTDSILFLFRMKPTPCCCPTSSPLNQKPLPSSVVLSPHFHSLSDSESLTMPHSYSSSDYVSPFSFLHWFKVRTFHVPTVMFSLGSLMCVTCHLFLWAIASVDVVGAWKSWKGPFLPSVFHVLQLTEITNSVTTDKDQVNWKWAVQTFNRRKKKLSTNDCLEYCFSTVQLAICWWYWSAGLQQRRIPTNHWKTGENSWWKWNGNQGSNSQKILRQFMS